MRSPHDLSLFLPRLRAGGAWISALLALCVAAGPAWSQEEPIRVAPRPVEQQETVETSIRRLEQLLPAHTAGLSAERTEQLLRSMRAVDVRGADLAFRETTTPDQMLRTIDRLSTAKRQVDGMARDLLERRFEVADMAAGRQRDEAVRRFLQVSSALIDLSGRLNYELRYTILGAAYWFAGQPELRERLVDRLVEDQSTVGAILMASLLIDPPADSPNQARPAPPALKRKVISLMAQTGRNEALPSVVEFVKNPQSPPDLVLLAAHAIGQMGLPQERPPWQKPEDEPDPAITAGELQRVLQGLDVQRLTPAFRQYRAQLLDWVSARAGQGIGPAGYAVNGVTFQPGDWLLMRNSSPYNLFTDLSPGLFTHVGVLAEHRDDDGLTRLVLVDVTERQPRVRGENIETMLSGPLYYAVLRHEDPEVARTMSEVAASLIGNPLQFDLTFETSRVEALRGEPLAGKKIHTYCAGLLLLAAQETDRPRDEFFPIPEGPASDKMAENLSKLGMRIGDDFISPTGPIFARRMQLVHLSEPMHDPGREIEQQIYDYFANRLKQDELSPRANLFQAMRQQLAEASKTNPVLAQALATLAGVHPDTDLAAGARAITVVESLDAAAETNGDEFHAAWQALQRGPLDERARAALTAEQIAEIRKYHDRHQDLVRQLQQNQLTRRGLVDALVAWYTARGRQQIDDLFFSGAPATSQLQGR